MKQRRTYFGTIISIQAIHYGHVNVRSRSGRSKYYRNARTSIWATVEGPRGGQYEVWLGKRPGRPGVPVDKQEKELQAEMQYLIGQEVEFTRTGRYRDHACFAVEKF